MEWQCDLGKTKLILKCINLSSEMCPMCISSVAHLTALVCSTTKHNNVRDNKYYNNIIPVVRMFMQYKSLKYTIIYSFIYLFLNADQMLRS